MNIFTISQKTSRVYCRPQFSKFMTVAETSVNPSWLDNIMMGTFLAEFFFDVWSSSPLTSSSSDPSVDRTPEPLLVAECRLRQGEAVAILSCDQIKATSSWQWQKQSSNQLLVQGTNCTSLQWLLWITVDETISACTMNADCAQEWHLTAGRLALRSDLAAAQV